MNYRYIAFSFATLLSASVSLHAQTKSPADSINSEQVDIVKSYEPVLLPTSKVEFPPNLPKITDEKPLPQQYNFTEKFAKISYQPEDLKPLKFNEPKDPENSLGFLRVGFGNYTTPSIKAAIVNKHQTDFKVGLSTDFIFSKAKKQKFQEYYEFGAHAFAAYNMRAATIGLDVDFDQDKYHYYGLDPAVAELLTKEDVAQKYTGFKTKLHLRNTLPTNFDIDYNASLGINAVSNSFDQSVLNFSFAAHAEKSFDAETFKVGVDIDGMSSTLKKNDGNTGLFGLQITPFVGVKKGIWSLEAGPVLIVNSGNIHLLPYLKNKVKISGDYVVLYNEWVGKLGYNNMATAYLDNPFIAANISYKNYRFEERTFAGLKGSLPFGLSYDVKFSQLVWHNAPLWVNDTTNFSQFTQVYDNKVKALNPHIELAYQSGKIFKISTSVDYYKFSTENQLAAWHLPTLKSTLQGQYFWKDQLVVGAEMFVHSGIKARNQQLNVENLKTVVDINLSAQYALKKYISFFAELNNIANVKSPRWNGYSTYGFHAIAGVKLLF